METEGVPFCRPTIHLQRQFCVRRPLSTCTLSLPPRPDHSASNRCVVPGIVWNFRMPFSTMAPLRAHSSRKSPVMSFCSEVCNVCPDPPSRPSNYRPVHQELHVRVLSGDTGCLCNPADRDDAARVSKIRGVRGRRWPDYPPGGKDPDLSHRAPCVGGTQWAPRGVGHPDLPPTRAVRPPWRRRMQSACLRSCEDHLGPGGPVVVLPPGIGLGLRALGPSAPEQMGFGSAGALGTTLRA